MRKSLSIIGLMLVMSSYLSAAVWYVKPSAESTAWANKAQTNVKTSFADAFSAAATSGDQIWFSAGTYPISATTSFTKSVKLYGGFAGAESAIEDRVKVTGGKAWEYVNVTYIEPTSTYTGTFMTTPSSQAAYFNGITFQKFQATPIGLRQSGIVEECVFQYNTKASGNCAGIDVFYGAKIYNCYFYKNTAAGNVGITVNAGNNPTIISGCVFEENTATNANAGGAALGVQHTSTVTSAQIAATKIEIVNCVMINNKHAGGTNPSIVRSVTPLVTVHDCLIANNEGRPLDFQGGGTAYNLTIVNNVVPTASTTTDAVFLADSVRVVDTDFSAKLHNSVVWGNVSAKNSTVAGIGRNTAISSNSLKFTVGNTACDGSLDALVQSGANLSNNILLSSENSGSISGTKYPIFTTPTTFVGGQLSSNTNTSDELTKIAAIKAADYTIGGTTSALINAGDNSVTSSTVDLLGNTRVQVNVIDLGAYESAYSISTAVSPSVSALGIARVYASEGKLEIEAATAARIRLFSTTGAELMSRNVGQGRSTLSVAGAVGGQLVVIAVESEQGFATFKVVL